MKKIFSLSILFIGLFLSHVGNAQNLPDYNRNQIFVSDFADVLTPAQEQEIQNKLSNFEKKTSIEIAVVTQNDLQDYPIEDYAEKLFGKWGIGKDGADNGLLILISPSNRKWKTEVGYGLEGF